MGDASGLSLGQCATLACLLEATAPKVGNVHRGADFEDLTFHDFAVSAVAIAPAIEAAPTAGMGQTVLGAISATRELVSTNTNLGMVLLIAPLAAVPRYHRLTPAAVHEVLSVLTPTDCQLVYRAIRLAQPGGLGRVEEMDIADEPPADLVAAMQSAADRDFVAREYVTDFHLVLEEALPRLVAGRQRGWTLSEAIVHTHLWLIGHCGGDSLIARKCGRALAREVAAMARQVFESGAPGEETYYKTLADFDFWLRADGNRRNPGATADLVAAAIFAGLRDGLLTPPWR